jgi:hypothetical protein
MKETIPHCHNYGIPLLYPKLYIGLGIGFSKKNLEIPKIAIRIRKSKDRQNNCQKKKDKRPNNIV